MAIRGDGNAFRETVRDANPLEDVASSYGIVLRSKGRLYWGLCPFHIDTKPSMSVSPERQSYRCWSCDTGGDVFSFVENMEGVEFREALETLAQRVGLQMPTRHDTPEIREQREKRKGILEALEAACSYFESNLPGSESEDYLLSRGISKVSMGKFRVGHAKRGLLNYLRNRGIDIGTMREAKLIIESKQDPNDFYDFFRKRSIFPIINPRGEVVAFTGRSLPGAPEDDPKYINSPETSVFRKREILYGLNKEVLNLARRQGRIIVTEGYTDVMMMQQEGMPAIGTMGTAFTEEHADLLARRFSQQKKIFCFDGDTPGKTAAAKAVVVTIPRAFTSVSLLPSGQDPASLLANGRKQDLELSLERQKGAFDFHVECSSEGLDTGTYEGKTNLVRRVSGVIQKTSQHHRGIMLETLSKRIGLSVPAIGSAVFGTDYANMIRRLDRREQRSGRTEAESALLRQILHAPSPENLQYMARKLEPKHFLDRNARAIFGFLAEKAEDTEENPVLYGGMPIFADVLLGEMLRDIDFPKETLGPYLAEIVPNGEHPELDLEDCVERVRKGHLVEMLENSSSLGERGLSIIERAIRESEKKRK